MNRRRRYGQHFLASRAVAARIVEMAGATADDTVLEVGTGRGALTGMLCGRAGRVVSVESDETLHREAALRMGSIPNLDLLHGDGFGPEAPFDVFVSNLPYSQSRRAVEWLAGVPFRRGVVMVQEEFAGKITSTGAGRRAISVVWQEAFETTGSFRVGQRSFDPPPRVGSVVLQFRKRQSIDRETIGAIHGVFSARRKAVACRDGERRRLADLSSREILDLARSLNCR